MSYRSKKIKAAPGSVIVAPEGVPTGAERVRQAVLDIATLPLVALGPRTPVELACGPVSLNYGFKRWNWRSERALEIGLARHALARHRPEDTLEVGNVLAFAGITGHTVVDKYEAGQGVINEDILDYRPAKRFSLVVSISTVEHIGWDEDPREPDKASAAVQAMAGMGDSLLITMPIGWHRHLEEAFVDGPFDRVELAVKTSRRARWEVRPLSDAKRISYARPFSHGNAIFIGSRGDV